MPYGYRFMPHHWAEGAQRIFIAPGAGEDHDPEFHRLFSPDTGEMGGATSPRPLSYEERGVGLACLRGLRTPVRLPFDPRLAVFVELFLPDRHARFQLIY